MRYINERDIMSMGINWSNIIDQLDKTVNYLNQNEYEQPIKPYLRYKNIQNRIIAMPAYVGGDINISGIKWIASFPDNINNGIPRAHSIVVLNNADTGQPVCIINTALLSNIRTAGVSGLFMSYYKKSRELKNIKIGIIGYGPIGKYHYAICKEVFKGDLEEIYLYDIRGINKEDIHSTKECKVTIAENWQEVYEHSDILITCTVSNEPYIDMRSKKGKLLLNISLRDYKTEAINIQEDLIIVDDWDEVCREKTDIELMHKKLGLNKVCTKSIVDVVCNNCLAECDKDKTIMFNPMGMAVFDIATGNYYYNLAEKNNIGTVLE